MSHRTSSSRRSSPSAAWSTRRLRKTCDQHYGWRVTSDELHMPRHSSLVILYSDMTLPFSPACLPLLLGGLPYRSAAQALEISRRYAGSLLAWPQLPRRGFREQGYVQSAIGFPGLVI